MTSNFRSLRVFLCHASQDKPTARELQNRFSEEGWIDPWLDEKKLLPGVDWRVSIEKAVEHSDIVLICLSNNSVDKEGFVQKELRFAREMALEKPEGSIFLIPIRLDDCEVPRGLRFFQWTDYFGENKEKSYREILESFSIRRNELSRYEEKIAKKEQEKREKEERDRLARLEEETRIRHEREELIKKQAEEKVREEQGEIARKLLLEKAKQDAFEAAVLEAKEEARKTAEQMVLKKQNNKFSLSNLISNNRWVIYLSLLTITLTLLVIRINIPGSGALVVPVTITTFPAATITLPAIPSSTSSLMPIDIATATEFISQYPTVTITPLVTPTITSTPLPISLQVESDGNYKFHFVILNPPECNMDICQIRWMVWEGSWIDGKQANGVDMNSFDFSNGPDLDTGWKAVSSSNMIFDLDTTPLNLLAPAPRRPHLVAVEVCLDSTKNNCQKASGIVP